MRECGNYTKSLKISVPPRGAKILSRLKSSGFTLVELMVVVALIGILARIAISNYQKYQAKARQSEAKIALAAIFIGEAAFFAEKSSYTQCAVIVAGVEDADVLNAKSRYFYTVGLANDLTQLNCGPAGTSACYAMDWLPNGTGTPQCGGSPHTTVGCTDLIGHWENAFINGALSADCVESYASWVSKDAFTASANGSISASATRDVWTVDQNKAMRNTQVGL